MRHISSRQNRFYKEWLRIAQAAGGSRSDLVLLEGVHLCSAWLQHFGAPNAVLLDQSQINESALAELFDALVDDAPTYVLSPGLFKDRKSTRLNSSHVSISYAVFCLKKKR